MNTSRGAGGATITATDTIAFGGQTASSYFAQTEHWNGTVWTELSDLALARNSGGGHGTSADFNFFELVSQTSVQFVPSQDSVCVPGTPVEGSPPAIKAAVTVPIPPLVK